MQAESEKLKLRPAVIGRIGFGALVLVILLGLFVARFRAAEPGAELPVLFIGNSLTYYNELPEMVAELAAAGGQRPLRYERQTPGGCTLEKHWNDGKALAKIHSRKWQIVVLQDHSQAALTSRPQMFEFAKKFDAEIHKQGAQTMLYMTWAMQNQPQQQATISKAYDELSRELHARLAPVGNAWQTALADDKNLVLHVKDQKHPKPTGTYLAACVFYASIYGKSPEGLPGRAGGLTDEQARPLQAIAWKTVQSTGR